MAPGKSKSGGRGQGGPQRKSGGSPSVGKVSGNRMGGEHGGEFGHEGAGEGGEHGGEFGREGEGERGSARGGPQRGKR